MSRTGNKSFLVRLVLCMVVSLLLNLLIGQYLKSSLSKGNFTVNVDADYSADAPMELMYDTGKDFNQRQRVPKTLKKGRNTVQFPFNLGDGEQLRYLRLDFGTDTDLKKVELNSVSLSSGGEMLFRLKKEELSEKIGLFTGISLVNGPAAVFAPNIERKPFDPYIVFDAVNELIFPKWQRTLMLVLPWIILLFSPFIRWLKLINTKERFILIFVGLFCAAVSLKIAWVTFTSLLLVAYALFSYYKRRTIKFDPVHVALLVFFLVPLLFLGNWEVSRLGIPIGFVLFVTIGSLIDFSGKTDPIKKIYSTVFLIVSSISVVSWLLLIAYYGHYYKIGFTEYFTDIKTHAHATMFWLYYPHTTFLSFFIVIGGIFCVDLYEKGKIGRAYGLLYGVLALCTLVLLGSRYAIGMGLALPLLAKISTKKLGKWLVPAWAVVFVGVTYFIGDFDIRRHQLWKISWEAFKEKPWMGHGTGTSDGILNDLERVRSAGFDSALDMNHSHNQLLTYLLENGLLGTLLFLAAFFFIVHRFSLRGNKTMLLICFMVLLLMIVESPFRTTTPLYVIAFLFSIFAAEGTLNSKRTTT